MRIETLPRPKLVVLLAIGAAVAFCAALPALLPLLKAAADKAHKPLSVLLVAQGVQLVVVCAVAAFAGSYWAPKAGYALTKDFRAGEALLVGTIATAATLAALYAVKPWAPPQLWQHAQNHDVLAGASSAFYGGFVEELLMRWALLSGLTLLLRRRFWPANIATALLFGIGHLPAAAHIAPLGAGLLAHVLIGNCVAGLFFGWLYKKRGLASAMVAHGTADVWLHGIVPLFA